VHLLVSEQYIDSTMHGATITLINKPLLLHLVGCLIIFISTMHGQANIK